MRLQGVAVAVNSLRDAVERYQGSIGLDPIGDEQESEHGFRLRWQTMGSGGVGIVDLIEPTDEQSMIAKFLASRGEGLYLVQMGVPDVRAAAESLRSRGVRLIGADSTSDAELQMFWIHPRSACGALFEVVPQKP